ncbi:polyribonucleotide nucleotidyltransferase [Owenweeksia hongkongensis]|uniref:Polyribonucleotide nucleotidyltransferase n=1 Tax=Owenweeksia hongkongensis (strain DSM 17368 / CIP 108786 / JCM 12287 / NRRL B-23963 / UST20020801) TaxID=926562 RepID=G8R8S8_OWEHD|nr:polyribonucleotide nucleotidyltransferase [Owenweeksia hongkongensis]AEV32508.1 polyribonucleotide nucleotidyltransferase [Owenweeksia hongkongensis DSM 17368]
MIPNPITQEITLADGRTITLETGKLAKQADGSVVVKMGGTMLLATVVSAPEAKEGVDFLPLTVDYREKFAAAGRMPGGFLKREARPTDEEILVMRLVDRCLRPLFPEDYHAEIQLMISLLSYDPEVSPDALCGLAASTAIALSDLPFDGPMSEARVGRVDGKLMINPSPSDMEKSDLDMMIGATKDSVVMVEGEMKEISEKEMVEAIAFGHEAIKSQIDAQLALASQVEKSKTKREYSHETHDEELKAEVLKATYDDVYAVAKSGLPKHERSEKFKEIRENYKAKYTEEELAEKAGLINTYYHDVEYKAMRAMILEDGQRLDGRALDEVRPIWSEIDYLPGAHGSAVFTRGETQSLTTVTLGSRLDEKRRDGVTETSSERFYLHYNFPPFSTGEARPIRGTSRREIGHGNLAQRALEVMLPDDSIYTIRVVSDILESNGSSSMATVCAGSLALMDAGVKMKKAVSGIAMGLITDPDTGKYAVLSDILGDEDHLGDMDFKVTGTKDGITACQMDIKVKGLSYEILEKALEQSKAGRLHILGEIMKTISEPREDVKPGAPKIETMTIPKDFIGAIIGPGGKNIQKLQADTETTITIEEEGDKGMIEISGTNRENMNAAMARIKAIAFVPEVGEVYTGKVKSIQAYGAFVEIAPGTDGLLHISEIDHRRLKTVDEVLKEGDSVEVKLIGVDDRGKMKLSRKVLLPQPSDN